MQALCDWLQSIDYVSGSEPQPASVDASFRRYFRVQKDARSFIVMDAPPEQEDCQPFIKVAGFLEAMHLNAPRILEANSDAGFLLLTDLGSRQYLEALQDDPNLAGALYGDALEALAQMQERGAPYQGELPPYDEKLLRFELSLFHDWLCGTHLGLALDPREWQVLCDLLVQNAFEQPAVFVHRDYHSRNLMVTAEHNPGILDFQDAVEGPLTYDLVSLLKDCYIQWDRQQVTDWVRVFYERLDGSLVTKLDFNAFRRQFDLMGVQRHIKAAGIFARLNHRDGKPAYMLDIPRTLSYIVQLETQYPELDWLIDLVNTRVLPQLGAES